MTNNILAIQLQPDICRWQWQYQYCTIKCLLNHPTRLEEVILIPDDFEAGEKALF